jgi:dihydrofolate synthase/folylpolyglutamate synthase
LRDDLHVSSALLVVGVSHDKAVDALSAELAPIASEVIATQSRNPRAAAARTVVEAFGRHGVPVSVQTTVDAATDAALAQAAQGEAIVACGSLFVAAEVREHVLGVAYDPSLAPTTARSKVLA